LRKQTFDFKEISLTSQADTEFTLKREGESRPRVSAIAAKIEAIEAERTKLYANAVGYSSVWGR
jgi:hypothetical protein